MIFVSTVHSPVFLSDLDGMELPHPTNNFLLTNYFDDREISRSASLEKAVADGFLVLIDTESSLDLFRSLIAASAGWQRIRLITEPWRVAEFMSVVATMDLNPFPAKFIWNSVMASLKEEDKPTKSEIEEWKNITITSRTSIIPIESHKIVFLDNGFIAV